MNAKNINELKNNKNNTIADFKDRKEIIKKLEDIKDKGPQLGYLVIDHFAVSKDLEEHLCVDNGLALLISKNKVYDIMTNHGLSASEIYGSIVKAASEPEAIVYDIKRNSFQFSVELAKRGYRVVIIFNTVPDGLKNIRTDVLTSVFEESRYRNRIESIKKRNIANLFLIYDACEGWAALATHSHSGIF